VAADSAVPVVQWSPHAAYKGRQINVGPTGIRAWVDENRIIVTHVAAGSPACGLVRPNDVITGAGGKDFEAGKDPRVAAGDAITAAETESGGGKLALHVVRNGSAMNVVVPIRVMGAYGPNWPFDCAKSSRIVDEACAYLAGVQYPDGHIPSEVGMATAFAGLLFLASGDAKYQDNARRAAQWLSDRTWEDASLNCWPSGYGGVLLAEYYLATGDRSVLPTLKKLTDFLARSQMACGSWGHNGPWGGYGAVNQVGEVCLMAMVLGAECGVEQDQVALKRGLKFFERYADKGWVPYGDHKPYMGNSDNGKSALAAVVFALNGGYDKAVGQFASCVAGSYDFREDGHTGSYFSFFWGPLAVRLAGQQQLRTFLDHQRWYYDLCRTYDGGLVSQPNPENLSGRTPGTYTWSGPAYTTAGMALVYAIPRKAIRITGAPKGPFAADVPDRVKELRNHWTHRERKQFDKLLEQTNWMQMPPEIGKMVGTLKAVAKRQDESVKLTLASIKNDISEGDVYRASEKLKSLERLLGKDAPELADAQKLMAANEQWVETGQRYYKAFDEMSQVADEYWHYYGKRAAEAVGDMRPIMPHEWTALVPALVSDRSVTIKADGKTVKTPFDVKSTDIAHLRLRLLTPKASRVKV